MRIFPERPRNARGFSLNEHSGPTVVPMDSSASTSGGGAVVFTEPSLVMPDIESSTHREATARFDCPHACVPSLWIARSRFARSGRPSVDEGRLEDDLLDPARFTSIRHVDACLDHVERVVATHYARLLMIICERRTASLPFGVRYTAHLSFRDVVDGAVLADKFVILAALGVLSSTAARVASQIQTRRLAKRP